MNKTLYETKERSICLLKPPTLSYSHEEISVSRSHYINRTRVLAKQEMHSTRRRGAEPIINIKLAGSSETLKKATDEIVFCILLSIMETTILTPLRDIFTYPPTLSLVQVILIGAQ